ncbi:MAG: ankyrin repeat domain-containing protein [Proteobacteria bacterium]|nr:ankyrin repeat domain-containing protein [Pseudomonadota bacterium]
MQDELGETALHAASGEGHVSVITALVERGADVNCLTKVGGVHSTQHVN